MALPPEGARSIEFRGACTTAATSARSVHCQRCPPRSKHSASPPRCSARFFNSVSAAACLLQNCPQLPLELSGTLGVAATGVNKVKAYYSNVGSLFVQVCACSCTTPAPSVPESSLGQGPLQGMRCTLAIRCARPSTMCGQKATSHPEVDHLACLQVAAPGGDFGQTSSVSPTGGVLGAYPADFSSSDSTFVQENGAYYAYLQVLGSRRTVVDTATSAIRAYMCERGFVPPLHLQSILLFTALPQLCTACPAA
jgi:hypothetical protein